MNQPGSQWQTEALTRTYLDGVRGAIPLAQAQIDVLLHIVDLWCAPCSLSPVESTAGREGPTGGRDLPPVGSTGGTEGGCHSLRVLDLGCGDGILARSILKRFPNTEAVLVDHSQPMLDAAGENVGDDARVQIVQADFTSAGWLNQLACSAAGGKEPEFDLVVSGFAIHHSPHDRKHALYAQVYDLLAPGGVFLHLEHVDSPTQAIETLFDEYFIDHLYAYHSARNAKASRDEISRTHYNRPDKVENILALVDVQCDWLREIGFVDVDCFFKAFELALFGGRKPK